MTDIEITDPKSLCKFLRYDPENGKLFWRERSVDMFNDGQYSATRECKRWNTRYSGKEALTSINSEGYKSGCVCGRHYKSHRIIWAMFYGYWPKEEIDHINGDRTDNRISNLRDVSKSRNQRNAAIKSTNNSGYCGVTWDKQSQKWKSHIRINGKQKTLGRFEKIGDAILARREIESVNHYTERHGK